MIRKCLIVILASCLPLPLSAEPAAANPTNSGARIQQSVQKPKAKPIVKKLNPAQAERLSRMAMEYGERMLRSGRHEVAIKQLRMAHKLNRQNTDCIQLLIQAHTALSQWPEVTAYRFQLHQAKCPECLDGIMLGDSAIWVDRQATRPGETDLPPAPVD